MTANFDMIQKIYTGFKDKVENARRVVGRPLTYAEKILYAHLWEPATRYSWPNYRAAKSTRGRDGHGLAFVCRTKAHRRFPLCRRGVLP